MNTEKILFVIGCSAAVYFIITSIYDAQFKDEDYQYDENWLGDLCGLNEEKK